MYCLSEGWPRGVERYICEDVNGRAFLLKYCKHSLLSENINITLLEGVKRGSLAHKAPPPAVPCALPHRRPPFSRLVSTSPDFHPLLIGRFVWAAICLSPPLDSPPLFLLLSLPLYWRPYLHGRFVSIFVFLFPPFSRILYLVSCGIISV